MPAQSTPSVEWTQSYKEYPSKKGFLDLPREIRDYVYTFAFRVQGAIFLFSKNPYTMRPVPTAKIVRHGNEGSVEPQRLSDAIPISMMRVCQQLHAECTPVLYGGNVFRVWFLSETELALAYRQLIRHIIFTAEPDQRMYKPRWSDLDEVGYGWRWRFWPNIIEKGTRVLDRFPILETLTVQLTPAHHGQLWKPAFFAIEHKTKEHRIAVAARWMHPRCPMDDARLRTCLRLELQHPIVLEKEDYVGSGFASEEEDEVEWDCTEFADAFQLMKSFG